jgi:hypothetical protein
MCGVGVAAADGPVIEGAALPALGTAHRHQTAGQPNERESERTTPPRISVRRRLVRMVFSGCGLWAPGEQGPLLETYRGISRDEATTGHDEQVDAIKEARTFATRTLSLRRRPPSLLPIV